MIFAEFLHTAGRIGAKVGIHMQTESAKEPAPKSPTQHSVTTAALLATWRTMRRLFILLIGLTVLLLGVVMVVTPGPSILVIPLGLMILGIEFAWARRWLAKFKSYLPKKKPTATQPLAAPQHLESSPLAHRAASAESASSATPVARH